jgi:Raf kinase inhibitor-like YbhB/YbcL family protein
MRIKSPLFADGGSIPSKYTCDGQDAIPPLKFEDVPEGTAALALVMDDPDAPHGTWDHWVVWNIPPDAKEIREGAAPRGVFGRNSWGRNDWGGPCPPDKEHRYFFRLYALDRMLDLPAGSSKAELEKAMRGYIIAEGQLMGRYDRKKAG